MQLSLTERRRLRKIDKAIRRSDPRLAGLISMFSRLAAQDAMPGHERLEPRDAQAWDTMRPR